jgi:hypothetical protein
MPGKTNDATAASMSMLSMTGTAAPDEAARLRCSQAIDAATPAAQPSAFQAMSPSRGSRAGTHSCATCATKASTKPTVIVAASSGQARPTLLEPAHAGRCPWHEQGDVAQRVTRTRPPVELCQEPLDERR